MSTPYDGKIAVLFWQGSSVGELTIDQIIETLKQWTPNVKSIWIKTNDGAHWQGAGPAGPKPDLDINGVNDVARWISKAGAAGYDVHAWCVLNGTQPDQEANLVAQVCNVNGLKSMVLDIEVGAQYFTGGPQAVTQFAQALRAEIQAGFHLGLCLDARGNHPRDVHINQWLPFVDSLHPMAYHKDFGQTPDVTLSTVYAALTQYQKPIIPMLQGYGLSPNDHGDLLVAGNAAFGKYHAPGISIFRFGSLGPADLPFVAQINIPDASSGTHTFDFTGQQLKDAFGTVAAYLHQDAHQMIISAGLTNLDQQLNTKYVGSAVQDLPGLTEIQRNLIDLVLTGHPLPGEIDNIAGKLTNQQVINAFQIAAEALGQIDSYWNWIVEANLTNLADNQQARNSLYAGPAISDLPNLSPGIKEVLRQAVKGMLPISGNSTVLSVPWFSQVDPGKFEACGPTSVLMLLKAYGVTAVNSLQDMAPFVTIDHTTNAQQLKTAAQNAGHLVLDGRPASTDSGLINTLRNLLAQRKPAIMFLEYLKLRQAPFSSHLYARPGATSVPHWWVVIGTEGDDFIVNDPLWKSSDNGGRGGNELHIASTTLLEASLDYLLVPINSLP